MENTSENIATILETIRTEEGNIWHDSLYNFFSEEINNWLIDVEGFKQ